MRKRLPMFLMVALALITAACVDDPADVEPVSERAHLTARPGAVTEPLGPGKHPLGLAVGRDGSIYLPEGYDPQVPTPLVVLLHGATGRADNWEGGPFRIADSLGVALMAPDARGQTWDAIRGDFGPDVDFIDDALEVTFRHVNVDAAHVALGGFSDGASYALSLGLSNGDLFTHVIAFSPGFMVLAAQRGRPPIFVSHGTRDGILPIDVTSRRLVPTLQGSGYSVTYEEFDGTHELPRAIGDLAFDWFLN